MYDWIYLMFVYTLTVYDQTLSSLLGDTKLCPIDQTLPTCSVWRYHRWLTREMHVISQDNKAICPNISKSDYG